MPLALYSLITASGSAIKHCHGSARRRFAPPNQLRALSTRSGGGRGRQRGRGASGDGPSPGGKKNDQNKAVMAFRPRRRPHPSYRPTKPLNLKKEPTQLPETMLMPQREQVILGENEGDTEMERDFGVDFAHMMDPKGPNRLIEQDPEEMLRMADYYTSMQGTAEDLIGERRALAHLPTKEREEFKAKLKQLIREEELRTETFDTEHSKEEIERIEADRKIKAEFEPEVIIGEDGDPIGPNQLAFGPWGETTVRVDRVQKVMRGGTTVRYRCLMIGGNGNGCAGFGVGKALSPQDAAIKASRETKRNIFFVDRYLGTGLTRDLQAKHNGVIVRLIAVNKDRGLHGNPLIENILKYFGITDCTCKAFGNRNPFSVVRATFKALMLHESLEEMAMKRGRRLVKLEKLNRLEI